MCLMPCYSASDEFLLAFIATRDFRTERCRAIRVVRVIRFGAGPIIEPDTGFVERSTTRVCVVS